MPAYSSLLTWLCSHRNNLQYLWRKPGLKCLSCSPHHAASWLNPAQLRRQEAEGKDTEEPSSLSPWSSQQRLTAAQPLNWEVLFWIAGKIWAFKPWASPLLGTALNLSSCFVICLGWICQQEVSLWYCYTLFDVSKVIITVSSFTKAAL